jgi:hypothetical protein
VFTKVGIELTTYKPSKIEVTIGNPMVGGFNQQNSRPRVVRHEVGMRQYWPLPGINNMRARDFETNGGSCWEKWGAKKLPRVSEVAVSGLRLE